MRAQGRPGRRGRAWPREQRRPCCLESQPEPPQGGHGPGLLPVRSFLVLTGDHGPGLWGPPGVSSAMTAPPQPPAGGP